MNITPSIADTGTGKRLANRAMTGPVRYKANEVGREMVRLANKKMAGEFDLNRPGGRRRYPSTRRARNALDYQVDARGEEVEVRYRVLGGEQVKLRILGLNYGIPSHEIVPSGAWELSRSALPEFLVWPHRDGGIVKAKRVQHPGQRRKPMFLEEARDEAVARIVR